MLPTIDSLQGERCTLKMPDSKGSVPMDLHWWLWTQRLRDTQVDCLHSHGWGEAEGSANNCVLSVHPTGDRWHQSALPSEQLLRRNTQWLLSQWKCSSPTYPTLQLRNRLGVSTPTTREQTLSLTGLWQPQSKEEAPLNIQCRLWSPQHKSHTLSRG